MSKCFLSSFWTYFLFLSSPIPICSLAFPYFFWSAFLGFWAEFWLSDPITCPYMYLPCSLLSWPWVSHLFSLLLSSSKYLTPTWVFGDLKFHKKNVIHSSRRRNRQVLTTCPIIQRGFLRVTDQTPDYYNSVVNSTRFPMTPIYNLE